MIKMLAIYDDAIIKISEKLSDKEKIYLSMSSKQLDSMKFKMKYSELISIVKIESLAYFDNFENVDIYLYTSSRYPKSAKFIHLSTDRSSIPSCVTHLILRSEF